MTLGQCSRARLAALVLFAWGAASGQQATKLPVAVPDARLIERDAAAAGNEPRYSGSSSPPAALASSSVQNGLQRLVGSERDRLRLHIDHRGNLRFLAGFQSYHNGGSAGGLST